MSKSRALQDLMTAVDAGHVIDSSTTFSDNKLLAPRRSSYGRSRRQSSRAVVVVETPPAPASSDDASFEFSAIVSNSSASPASMVFSDGQLRAHQYPAVRSAAAGSSQVASPVLSSSMGSSGKAGGMGSKKRVSFAMDSDGDKAAATKAGGGQLGTKKPGGLLGCMGSACGSSRNEVVEPAKNANRKVVAV